MPQKKYNVIGLMSGTSLDGIDLAHLQFTIADEKWDFEIFECETIAYSPEWVAKLKSAIDYSEGQLKQLNIDYTALLGDVISTFIKKYNIENLDLVASHGHTTLHQPQHGYTLQIGNLPEIATIIGETVVCDFRVDDVKLGGQGAPLVPIGDRILFSPYDYCLNLGGFSNISFEHQGSRIAFDISAVNTVLNFYANQLGFDYDNSGNISKTGRVNNGLLQRLNDLDYYKQNHPKSLGFEYVKGTLLPLIESHAIPIEDKMHTFTEHIAIQTAFALSNTLGQSVKSKMLVTGGGAYNDFLIQRLQFHMPDIKIVVPERKILEFKEALVFGLLGVLRLRNEVNVLASVTGAWHDHSSGTIWK